MSVKATVRCLRRDQSPGRCRAGWRARLASSADRALARIARRRHRQCRAHAPRPMASVGDRGDQWRSRCRRTGRSLRRGSRSSTGSRAVPRTSAPRTPRRDRTAAGGSRRAATVGARPAPRLGGHQPGCRGPDPPDAAGRVQCEVDQHEVGSELRPRRQQCPVSPDDERVPVEDQLVLAAHLVHVGDGTPGLGHLLSNMARRSVRRPRL